MTPRVVALIEKLGLEPHPEGGFYREVFRSDATVHPDDGRPARSALTSIYFLLPGGAYSRWHRVTSDEVWHYYEGDPLELAWISPDLSGISSRILGPLSDVSQPVHVVPEGCWQMARPLGGYTLTGCTVGPGFDFADFQLLTSHAAERREVSLRFPDAAAFL